MDTLVKEVVLHNIRFEFHFNKINFSSEVKYFINARSEFGETYSFNMVKDRDTWRIVNAPRVLDLFIDYEKKLSDIINGNLEENLFKKS